MDSIRIPTLAKRRLLASRLTQVHRREVKGSRVPVVTVPKAEHVCGGCGTRIRHDKKLCRKCWKQITPSNFRVGRKMAHNPEALAKRAATQSKQWALNREFDLATLPAWFLERRLQQLGGYL